LSSLLRPRSITTGDSVAGFTCGEPSLDNWLTTRAIANERSGASRTFVSLDKESQVVAGYYCLAASSMRSEDAAGALKRNMPDPIPIILIGRLAVDERFGGRGLGASLLQDALMKSVEAAQLIGAHAVVVHALNVGAENFYTKFGFVAMPHATHVMYLLTADSRATVATIAP